MKRMLLVLCAFMGLCVHAQADGGHLCQDALVFDLKGHVKECKVRKTSVGSEDERMEFLYRFDASGKHLSTEKQLTVKRDESGKIIHKKYYVDVGLNPGYEENTYKYNAANLLVEEVKKAPFDGGLIEVNIKYTYDDRGLLVQYVATDEYSQPTVIDYKNISVDSHGNWTKRTYTLDYGLFVQTTIEEIREITYY